MASGDTLVVFTPLANEPPASLYATLDTRNSQPCLDFDATSIEFASFSGVLPRNYGGGGITVYLHWRASSATSGAVYWLVAFERCNTDADANSFATQQGAGSTTNGTSGISTITSIAFTNGGQIDSLAAGEEFRLSVQRDAPGASGTDDMTGDAELFKVELRET